MIVIPIARGSTGRLGTLAGDATSQERYRTLFRTMPQGVIHCAADGSVIDVNPAASEILGLDLAAVTSWPVVPQGKAVREDGSPFPTEDLPVPVALRTGEIVADVVVGVRHGRTGELRWVRVTAVPDTRDDQGRSSRAYAILTDLTDQRRTEAALRQSNALLGRLRDANVLGVVVVGEHQLYEANDAYLGIIGYNRNDLEAGRVHWRKITPPGWDSVEDKAMEQLLQTGACQPFEKEYLHKDGHRVPVLIGAAVIDRDPLRWTSFVVDLTSRQRAEQERAELLGGTFAREHAIAETLQRALLPDALPQIPGLDLAVRYLPATEGASVGGDWYDAFPLADGRVGLVIGDVSGHNIASASTMGQVRSVLSAYAIDDPEPGSALQRTNAAMAQLLPNALATVVYAVLDPATGELTYANAGHPPPIIATSAGQAEYLDDTAGTMLGVCSTTSFTTGHRRLPPGARLLCYTDGLIEVRRRDILEGLSALAETLRRSPNGSAEQTCATVQAAFVGTARQDDICLLTARLTGPLSIATARAAE